MPSDPEFLKWLIDVRRDFHRHPEIAFEEARTSQKIVEILQSLDIETQRLEGMSGVVGLIKGTQDGPTLALRADMDALPIQELNAIPYKSVYDGKMHACGHEASVTILLGTAKSLMDSGLVNKISGNVKFLFQPAEERGAGAKAMLAKGVLHNPKVDRIIAGHMDPDIPVGQVGHFKSLGYASVDRFALKITGKGGHGARPEECIDPLVAGAYFITQLQSVIARNIKPAKAGVITVGKFRAGDVANVIPESAYLEGSTRALTTDVRQQIIDRLHDLASGLQNTFMVKCDLEINEGVPCLVNDTQVAEFLHKASGTILGPENSRYINPVMASEDFSYFTESCPGAIMRFGCSNIEKGINSPLHSAYFDIDERVLDIGVQVFVQAIREYLRA